MIHCRFHLNAGQLSTLSCPGIGFFPAYSGESGSDWNNPDAATIQNIGPLPPGQYYIVSRGTGGVYTPINDYFASNISGSDRSTWFALYRNDSNIDDVTFYKEVSRGHFRLHPAGYEGISHGCITLPSKAHFSILRETLLNTPIMLVGSSLRAYGTVQVY